MTPYERVVEALKGTTLEGRLAAIAMETGMRDDAPEWSIAFAVLIATTPYNEAIQQLNETLIRLDSHIGNDVAESIRATLDDKWRDTMSSALAGAIVKTASQEIVAATEQKVAEIGDVSRRSIAASEERMRRLAIWKIPAGVIIMTVVLSVLASVILIAATYRLGQHNSPTAYLAGESHAVAAEWRCARLYRRLCNAQGK